MRPLLAAPWLLVALGCVAAVAGQTAPNQAELEPLLRQLEARGRAFQNFTAAFSQRKYTAVLEEFDAPESGVFVYARAKDGSALLRQEVRKPAPRVLTIKGGVATVHQPALKQAQVMNLGKNKDKAEYLALGVGQSPAKLRETFVLKYLGVETVGGTATSVLNLQPKNSLAAAYFSSITLWIARSTAVPVQQKLQEPNGDYLLVNFTDIKLNAKVADGTFDPKLPAGTDIQQIR